MADSLLRSALAGAEVSDPSRDAPFWTAPIVAPARETVTYTEYTMRVPVNPDVVFYETMSGDRMGDNPYAIFEYVRTHPEYGSFLHVWSMKDAADIPDEYRDAEDVVFVSRGTAAYAYFLASAGRIVGNANLPGYFTRRPEQKYLNTWHGIAYKGVGRDTPKARWGGPTGTRTFLKSTHVLSPCRFMTDAMLSGYSMTGASTAIIGETGYPRVDLTVNRSPERVGRLRRKLGLEGDTRPVVLYAPTYRAEVGVDVVDADQLISDLNALASIGEVTLMYRGHHRMDRIIQDQQMGDKIGPIIIPPHDVSSNELMTAVDILISDYSSIFFDFLPTGRPVIHYLYDLAEYGRSRGLNLELDELPGTVAQTHPELIRAVQEAAKALQQADPTRDHALHPLQGERYSQAQRRFCPHEDGSSSRRAVDFFFADETSGIPVQSARGARPTSVFWAAAHKEGSATMSRGADATQAGPEGASLSAALHTAALDEFLHTVLASGHAAHYQTTLVIERDAEVIGATVGRIRKLKTAVSTVAFEHPQPILLPSEQADYRSFTSRTYTSLEDVRQALRENPTINTVFVREYRRRLDDSQFDTVVLGPDLRPHEMALACLAKHGVSLAIGPASTTPEDNSQLAVPHTKPFSGTVTPAAKTRVLLFSDRDADDVGVQVGEATAVAMIKGILLNLGMSPLHCSVTSRSVSTLSKRFLSTGDPKASPKATEAIANSDLIVLAGTPLNYRHQDSYMRTMRVLETAQAHGVPVVFAGIGLEPCDQSDPKCRRLMTALSLPVVRMVSTSDGPEGLAQYLTGTTTPTANVAGPALLASIVFSKPEATRGAHAPAEQPLTASNRPRNLLSLIPTSLKDVVAYGAKLRVTQLLGLKPPRRRPSPATGPSTSNTTAEPPAEKPRIGLVVTRAGLFKDNSIPFTAKLQRQLWLDIIESLEELGCDYRLFTTGQFADEALLDQMIREDKVPADKTTAAINSPEELLSEIKACTALISFREEASALAYSHGIPSIGLSWSPQVHAFYELIGLPGRSLSVDHWNAPDVMAALVSAIEAGVSRDEALLMSGYEALFSGMKDILRPESDATPWTYAQLAAEVPRYPGTTAPQYRDKVERKLRRAYEAYRKHAY